MPVVGTSPYDTADYVLNLARSIVNDAAQTIEGNLLSNAQPYTIPMLNSVYRTLQEDLTDRGIATFAEEAILVGVLPVVGVDPATQVNVSYTGYNNGSLNYANPILPADMVGPLRLWERQTGTTQQFIPMLPANDGLSSDLQTLRLGQWEWRSDAIWMKGATISNDLRLRYNRYLPELLDGDSQVMILRSDRALAYLMAREYGFARGSQLSDGFEAKYEAALTKLTGREQRQKQRNANRRQPYSARVHNGWGWM